MKKILLLKFFFVAAITASFGQITVQNSSSPANLVQEVLLGTGVVATNVKYNGSLINANQIQPNVTYFDAQSTTFPIGRGVLLTTGAGSAAVGPNNSTSSSGGGTPMVTDPDLAAIAAAGLQNGAILEFDFVPQGDSLSFSYIFGSDEYPEFAPPNSSGFNDVFGFFISGPGFAGPFQNGAVNIALVPGTTTPVSINNVNPATNSFYYVSNGNGSTYGTAIQYDGVTKVLKALAQVQCGETYHIKLAIANVGDTGYDSGVFLEAESFTSPAIQVSFVNPYTGTTGDTVLYEGCNSYTVYFTRPTSDTALTVTYEITGTATADDYSPLANPITFAPGEDTIALTIAAIADGITEPMETVTLTVYTVTVCGDTLVSTGTLYIYDAPPNVSVTAVDTVYSQCHGANVTLSATMTGGFPPYNYEWSQLGGPVVGTGSPLTFAGPSTNGYFTYIVHGTDACGVTDYYDTSVVHMNQTLAITNVTVVNAECGKTNGTVYAEVTGATGQIAYNWSGNGQPSFAASVYENIPVGTYFFTATDNVCTVDTSATISQDPPPVAQMDESVSGACNPVNASFENESGNGKSYQWNIGSGFYGVNDLSTQSSTYTQTTTVYLVAISGLCSDTTSYTVVVNNCGCTNSIAVNYDPNANFDDGTCILPAPSVIVPNVFTPNGDGLNDFFELDMDNVNFLEMVIIDRWGIEVFNATAPSPKWDGKLQNGDKANNGVYFYKYKAVGHTNTVEGQGFLHLVRD